MKGTPAIYLGRIVNKEKFRTHIYGSNGEKKLVESWASYEAAMQTGIWFATREDAMESVAPIDEVDEIESQGDVIPKSKSKSKGKSKAKSKPVKIEEVEKVEEEVDLSVDGLDDGMVYEVTDENR